jgi:hypothetical protein
LAVVVTAAKGYDLGYIWKTQGQASAERTVGGYYINAAQAGEPPGHPDRSTSSSTGSAANESSADSCTSTMSPPDRRRCYRRTQVTSPNRISEPHTIDVTIVAGSVQLSRDGKVIRAHPIRHDRPRELGAFANPKGRPAARTPPSTLSPSYRNSPCRPGTRT